MKAIITNGELKGVEFELSEETVANIKNNQIPKCVDVGQVYLVDDDRRMVVAIDDSGIGLVNVGEWPGCYVSSVAAKIITKTALRQVLIEKNARYLGKFNDMFKYLGEIEE